MACMEHQCLSVTCEWVEFDNVTWGSCPRCGGRVLSLCDEAGDRDDSADDE